MSRRKARRGSKAGHNPMCVAKASPLEVYTRPSTTNGTSKPQYKQAMHKLHKGCDLEVRLVHDLVYQPPELARWRCFESTPRAAKIT